MVLFFIFKQNIKLMHFITEICIFLIFKEIFLYEYSLKKNMKWPFCYFKQNLVF